MGSRTSFSLWNRFLVALFLFVLSFCLAPFQPLQGSTGVIYGPVVYERGTSQPTTIVNTFSVSNIVGTFTLVIENGDPLTGADRVTSALVSLNGATVASPNEFKKKVAKLEKVVELQSDNELYVQVRGKPGTYITITILADYPNREPVANAGPDQTVTFGGTVTLDGGASSDPDGNVLTFQWTLLAPSGSFTILDDPTISTPTFIADVSGTYVAELMVNDGALDSTPDSVTISTINSPPVAEAGSDQTIFVQNTVTLDGSRPGYLARPFGLQWEMMAT